MVGVMGKMKRQQRGLRQVELKGPCGQQGTLPQKLYLMACPC